jgi:dihydroorotase
MRYDLILKNGTLVTPAESFKGDVAVSNGKIELTGKLDALDTADDVYDAEGKFILPGIIDAHVHFRDPGLTEKEDFESGSMAAAFGGITLIADMPNVLPVTSTVERFNEKARIAKEKSFVDFALFALLAQDSDVDGLKKAGALAFKVFLGTSTGDIAAPGDGVLFEKLCECASAGMIIGFHAENSEINSHFTSICKKRNDAPAGQLLADARPVVSEVMAIQKALCYAQYTGTKIHIHHVTSVDGARLIEEARFKGLHVSAETCPHYLLLDANHGAYKVYPPVRDVINRKGLWDALGNGIIDMVASDHAPHAAHEKEMPIWEAPAGLRGVETFVPLFLNEVNKGRLSINDFVRLASESPAKIWGLYPQKGNLLPGADGDFTIVDMNIKARIDKNRLHSKNKTCAYDGMEVQGEPVATIVRGRFVMRDGLLTGDKGYGVLVSPAL